MEHVFTEPRQHHDCEKYEEMTAAAIYLLLKYRRDFSTNIFINAISQKLSGEKVLVRNAVIVFTDTALLSI